MSTKRCRVCKYNTMEAYLDGLRPCSECDAGVFEGTYEEVMEKTEASFLVHREDIKKGIMPDCIAEEGMQCRDCPVIREFSYCPWWDVAEPEEDEFDKELYIDYSKDDDTEEEEEK